MSLPKDLPPPPYEVAVSGTLPRDCTNQAAYQAPVDAKTLEPAQTYRSPVFPHQSAQYSVAPGSNYRDGLPAEGYVPSAPEDPSYWAQQPSRPDVYSRSNDFSEVQPSASNAGQLQLPVVIPQTSKSFKGAFFSPFVRAYVPQLELHGIDQSTFLTCVDGLNEAFIAHPLFQAAGGVGGLLGAFGGALPPLQWAGMGLQFASGLSSAATSYARTKMFVKKINEDLFHPAGLHMGIKTTKKMMEEVECPYDSLTLPSLSLPNEAAGSGSEDLSEESFAAVKTKPDDPCMRRIRALEGYVMPLNLDVPTTVAPDNFLRKMGNRQAQKQSQKQEKKIWKEREKGQKEYRKKSKDVSKAQREGEKEMEKVSRDMEKLQTKTQTKLESKKALGDLKEQDKIRREHDKEMAKLNKEKDKKTKEMDREVAKHQKDAYKDIDKAERKEQKTASKIRWVVITHWSDDQDSEDVASEDSAEP